MLRNLALIVSPLAHTCIDIFMYVKHNLYETFKKLKKNNLT